MSDTPRTDWLAERNYNRQQVPADFARELERENAHLLVLATNAEFDRSKLERENARLRDAALLCRPCKSSDEGEFVLVRKIAVEQLFAVATG